ncbi:MAG TPA: urea ABC transporter permease subunit UrtB [Jatrophihabitans sp.]
MDLYINQAFSGLGYGSILLLAALGLALTFGQMGVINMAHGEFIVAGAYTGHVMLNLMSNEGVAFIVAIPVSFIVAGLVGLVLETVVISRLYHRPLDTLLITFGVSLVLQQIYRDLFTPQLVPTPRPSWLGGNWSFGGVTIKHNEFGIFVFTIVLVCALAAVLKFSPLGRRIRATVQNRDLGESLGISTRTTDKLTFFLGSGLAGIAGVCLSLIAGTQPTTGQGYIVFAFVVVVLGGVGNIWGTVIAAYAFGMAQKLLGLEFSNDATATVIVFLAVVVFLQFRPQGIFSVRTRSLA